MDGTDGEGGGGTEQDLASGRGELERVVVGATSVSEERRGVIRKAADNDLGSKGFASLYLPWHVLVGLLNETQQGRHGRVHVLTGTIVLLSCSPLYFAVCKSAVGGYSYTARSVRCTWVS